MKQIFLFAMVLLTAGLCKSQTSGVIRYAEKIKLNLSLDGPAAAMMDSLPKEHVTEMVLVFNADASLYQRDKLKNGDISKDENGSHMRIHIDQPDNQFFRDLKNNVFVQVRDFMGRKFLIESPIVKSDWKLTGKQKTILDYTCQEAERQDKDRKITAWFTTSLPVSTGPGTAGNLPGLILEEHINGDQLVVTALEVNLKAAEPAALVKPKEGKKISQADFDKLVEEKMKEMDENGEGHDKIIIKTK